MGNRPVDSGLYGEVVWIDCLQDAAERLAVVKSEIVREAVMKFHDRLARLSDRERSKMLTAFDKLVPRIPGRSAAAVDKELAEVRRARKASGRRHAAF